MVRTWKKKVRRKNTEDDPRRAGGEEESREHKEWTMSGVIWLGEIWKKTLKIEIHGEMKFVWMKDNCCSVEDILIIKRKKIRR